MCYEENCLPICTQFGHLYDPYCQQTHRGLWDDRPRTSTGALAAVEPQKDRYVGCYQGATYIGSSSDDYVANFLGWLGIEFKTERQNANDCAAYLSYEKNQASHVDENCTIDQTDSTINCYYRIMNGK